MLLWIANAERFFKAYDQVYKDIVEDIFHCFLNSTILMSNFCLFNLLKYAGWFELYWIYSGKKMNEPNV